MGDPGYIGTSHISFSGLRSAWGDTSPAYVGVGVDPGSGSNSNISLSEFRGATFTDDTSVPSDSDEEISIEDDFKDKTFGSVTSYEFAINVGGTYTISGSLSSISPLSSGYPFTTQLSVTDAFHAYSMGARIYFLTAGTVVALGVQNQYGGSMALYSDNYDTPLATTTVAGTGSSSTNRNYQYTTLSSPVSVSANTYYRIAFKYTGVPATGGYGRHDISSYDGTNTTSGNMRLIAGMFKYVGISGAIARPTNSSTSYNYGATDLIFSPS
tara:strand:+ start:69 stop:875 length:807 start_codon:yes stop_codon:yes gene_type:complete